MPIKNHLYRFQPLQLYIILALSICYFSIQLVLSHLTHALTLLLASYHMLCNIIALTGCILTIKHSKLTQQQSICRDDVTLTSTPIPSPTTIIENEKNIISTVNKEEKMLAKIKRREMKLRNTFGWTRIDVLTMLIVCIILASLSFSLLVEALQTLVHIDHMDTMHLPISVMILGCVGLILNGLCYLMIGGYTIHQGRFLHMTPGGDVILDSTISKNGDISLEVDNGRLYKSPQTDQAKSAIKEFEKDASEFRIQPKRQGVLDMFRDVSSTIFVILCAIIVYLANDDYTSKYIDPILSIFSCIILLMLSFPYMKESCLILLQTIPDSIDMEIFERSLVSRFPEIISYHDLHIWQLSAHKYVSTVHIKFHNPKLYYKVIDEVRSFFFDQGITIVTIQPEFQNPSISNSLQCLIQCQTKACIEKVCCRDSRSDLEEINIVSEQINEEAHCQKSSKSRLKELKISSLLKLDKINTRSQSVNNINSNSSSEMYVPTLNSTNLKKTSSDLQVQRVSTNEIPKFKTSVVSLAPSTYVPETSTS